MRKIIFLDIDGTILDTEKNIPEKAKEGIFSLKEKGHEVAIATGRGPFMFREIREELDIHSYVSYNGQIVVVDDELIHQYKFPLETIEKIINISKEHNHPIVYMAKDQMIGNVQYDERVAEAIGSLKMDHPQYDEHFYKKEPISQILLFCEEGEEKLYQERFPMLNFIRWHRYSVDITPKGGSKASGIEKMLQYLNVPKENSYAFGDGLNDLEMLEAVGFSVAMGNGHPKAKKVADYVTKHVDEDGLYYAFKDLKLL